VRPVGKARFSVREVSESIRRDQGVEISPGYIGFLCSGQRDNPGIQQVKALATFFGVPASFLAGDGDPAPITRELEKLAAAIAQREQLEKTDAAMSDPGVLVVAVKARGISPDHLQLVSAMLDQVRQLEGLEHEPASPAATSADAGGDEPR
jgi:transcriptional regulator with XRE-family HTH domain